MAKKRTVPKRKPTAEKVEEPVVEEKKPLKSWRCARCGAELLSQPTMLGTKWQCIYCKTIASPGCFPEIKS